MLDVLQQHWVCCVLCVVVVVVVFVVVVVVVVVVAVVVVVVVLTLTRVIKSVGTGQAPVTLELRNAPGKTHKQTRGGTRVYHG